MKYAIGLFILLAIGVNTYLRLATVTYTALEVDATHADYQPEPAPQPTARHYPEQPAPTHRPSVIDKNTTPTIEWNNIDSTELSTIIDVLDDQENQEYPQQTFNTETIINAVIINTQALETDRMHALGYVKDHIQTADLSALEALIYQESAYNQFLALEALLLIWSAPASGEKDVLIARLADTEGLPTYLQQRLMAVQTDPSFDLQADIKRAHYQALQTKYALLLPE